ncbi:hypothetical protein PRUPE_5G215000 [Prunus persica]|nr:hypothetical protein PRUPE_5G215000 [Prunus persica]
MPNSGELLISFLMAMGRAVLDWLNGSILFKVLLEDLFISTMILVLKVLDEKMRPKISNFGWHVSFKGHRANTQSQKVVGTL